MYSDEEVNRAGNEPLPDVAGIFRGVYANFEDQVTAADFVQFAGVIGVRMCGGPVYKTVVGREDDTTPCPEYMMPAAFGVNASYEALTELWADKGINERELAALIGAHSVSVAFAQAANGIPPNSSQDSTPAVMDMNYYKETQANVAPAGVHRFDSDINLANASTPIGQAFTEYSAVGGLGKFEARQILLLNNALTASRLQTCGGRSTPLRPTSFPSWAWDPPRRRSSSTARRSSRSSRVLLEVDVALQ